MTCTKGHKSGTKGQLISQSCAPDAAISVNSSCQGIRYIHPAPHGMYALSQRSCGMRRRCGRFLHTAAKSDPVPIHSAAVGLFAGCLGSSMGLGGGFAALPFLTSFLKLNQHSAHATSFSAVLFTSIGGSLAYAASSGSSEKQNVDIDTAIAIAIPSAITTFIGANIAKYIPARTLKLGLGFFMLGAAPTPIIRQSIRDSNKDSCRSSTSKITKQYIGMVLGSCTGILSGVFGVGGGAIVVPALSLFTNMDYRTSLGTSLMAMFPTAVVGFTTHYLKRNMNIRVAIPLGLGSLTGSLIGGLIVNNKSLDDIYLKYIFCIMMSLLGARNIQSVMMKAN